MFFIIALIIFGLLFLIAELILLPGVTLAAVLSLICQGSAIYIAFQDYGTGAGLIVVFVIVVLSLITTVISLRSKTWQRFALKQKIESSSMVSPVEDNVRIGDKGVTVSRLSPMGKVEINGKTYEAKSGGDYVDAKSEIEVVGFENFNVIVKLTK